jgi:hypothetical protein
MILFDRGGSFGPETAVLGLSTSPDLPQLIRQIVSLAGKLSAENDP